MLGLMLGLCYLYVRSDVTSLKIQLLYTQAFMWKMLGLRLFLKKMWITLWISVWKMAGILVDSGYIIEDRRGR